MTDEVMTGARPNADARFARDILAANLPPVMLGPDSTARIDDELARVRCGCGQLRPSAVQSTDEPKRTGAGLLPDGTDARQHGVVREFARLECIAEIDLTNAIEWRIRPQPNAGADVVEWRAYADSLAENARLSAVHSKSNAAACDFHAANLAALKAALGVTP